MSKVSTGRVLVKGNNRLAQQIQRLLFKRGYCWPDGSKEVRDAIAPNGSEMWGIGFFSETQYTTVNGKPKYQKFQILSWTSRPEVFKHYPGRIVSPDLKPIRSGRAVPQRNPELIESL